MLQQNITVMKYLWIPLFICTTSFAEEKPVFYYLKIATNNVSVACFINGFPVYTYSGTTEMVNQIPVNLSLIGKNNELKIKQFIKHHCWMYLVTALVPSETACLASSPGRMSLTAD